MLHCEISQSHNFTIKVEPRVSVWYIETTMKKYYIAPVYGPKDQLVRYAGAMVEATPPEMRERKPQ